MRRNRKGQFVKRGKAAKRRRNPRAKRKTAAVAAPARRRKRKSSTAKRRPAMGYMQGPARQRRRKLNPRRSRARSRRRSNPRFSVNGIIGQLMPAALGAGGALALDVALGYIPLPAMLKSGLPRHGVRLAGALGVGFLARKFLGAKGNAVAQGALTVVMYGILKELAVKVLPASIPGLSDYEEIAIDNTADQIGGYLPDMSGDGEAEGSALYGYMDMQGLEL